jgi:hypothetical protein
MAATSGIQCKVKTLMLVEGLPLSIKQRTNYRKLLLLKLKAILMLLVNLTKIPSPRSVKLCYQRFSLIQTDLINAIFIAV